MPLSDVDLSDIERRNMHAPNPDITALLEEIRENRREPNEMELSELDDILRDIRSAETEADDASRNARDAADELGKFIKARRGVALG